MKQFISIALSFLMLLSSSGIAYAQHFCGDFEMMAKITLGQEKMTCGMVMEDPCNDEQDEEHSCCDNEYAQVTTDENFAAASFDLQVPPVFAAAFVSVFVLNTETFTSKEQTLFTQYHPPPLIKDIPVLFERFLI